MSRLVVARGAIVTALAALLAGAGTAAHATVPIAFVEYSGTGSTQGMGDVSGPFPTEARVDCASGECVFSATLHGDAYDWDRPRGSVSSW